MGGATWNIDLITFHVASPPPITRSKPRVNLPTRGSALWRSHVSGGPARHGWTHLDVPSHASTIIITVRAASSAGARGRAIRKKKPQCH
eukprot:3590360-Prymnesium_polylepis.1